MPRGASASPPEAAISTGEPRPAGKSAHRLARLKTRTDFLRVAATRRRAVALGLILQAAPQPEGPSRPLPGEAVRVGFTASRKVGNAVIRNRAKRRLRAAAAQVLTTGGRPGTDYVLIARAGTAARPYPALVADLESALRRVAGPTAPHRPAAAERN